MPSQRSPWPISFGPAYLLVVEGERQNVNSRGYCTPRSVADSASRTTHGSKAIATSAKHRHSRSDGRWRCRWAPVVGSLTALVDLESQLSATACHPSKPTQRSCSPELLLRLCLVDEGRNPCAFCDSGWLHLRQPQEKAHFGARHGALAALSRHLGLTVVPAIQLWLML